MFDVGECEDWRGCINTKREMSWSGSTELNGFHSAFCLTQPTDKPT